MAMSKLAREIFESGQLPKAPHNLLAHLKMVREASAKVDEAMKLQPGPERSELYLQAVVRLGELVNRRIGEIDNWAAHCVEYLLGNVPKGTREYLDSLGR